jgi:RES domain-containing protein
LIFRPEILDRLERIASRRFSGGVFRHVLGTSDPVRANMRGARWNPAGVAALYTSLERETALAEGEFLIAVQPFRPKIERKIVEIRVTLRSVIEMDQDILDRLDVASEVIQALEYTKCQEIGGAIYWLGHDGLIVPSARSPGTESRNLYWSSRARRRARTSSARRYMMQVVGPQHLTPYFPDALDKYAERT